MSLSPEQTREALEGYDQWVKEQMVPKPDFDALSTQRYLNWFTERQIIDTYAAIYKIAASDEWDEDLGKAVRKILGVEQGKPRVEVEE